MAPEPSAATQNLRTYGWEAGNAPSDDTNSTGTYGRTRAVARTEALPVDTASLTGGRATPLTESASVCIASVLQKNVNYRQDARTRARKEILMAGRLPGFGVEFSDEDGDGALACDFCTCRRRLRDDATHQRRIGGKRGVGEHT